MQTYLQQYRRPCQFTTTAATATCHHIMLVVFTATFYYYILLPYLTTLFHYQILRLLLRSPARIASALPVWRNHRASPMACGPEAHADTHLPDTHITTTLLVIGITISLLLVITR